MFFSCFKLFYGVLQGGCGRGFNSRLVTNGFNGRFLDILCHSLWLFVNFWGCHSPTSSSPSTKALGHPENAPPSFPFHDGSASTLSRVGASGIRRTTLLNSWWFGRSRRIPDHWAQFCAEWRRRSWPGVVLGIYTNFLHPSVSFSLTCSGRSVQRVSTSRFSKCKNFQLVAW